MIAPAPARRAHQRRHGAAPQHVADQVVLADVSGEAGGAGAARQRRQVRAPPHVALADDARRHADAVDRRVELGVRAGREHGLELRARWQRAAGVVERHHEWQLVHELVRPPPAVPRQLRRQLPARVRPHPHVAVDGPDQVALRFAVRARHLADLGVWAEGAREDGRVFIFGVDVGVEVGVLGKELGEDREGGVAPRGHAEGDRQLRFGVRLEERRPQAFVQAWIEAFDRPDYRDMRDRFFILELEVAA